MFIMSSTKMTAGIKVRNRLRRSCAKCIKYITANAPPQTASASKTASKVVVDKLW